MVCPPRCPELPAGSSLVHLKAPWRMDRAPRVADILCWQLGSALVGATAASTAGCRPKASSWCSRASGAVGDDRTARMEEADQKRRRQQPERVVSMSSSRRKQKKRKGSCRFLGGSWIRGMRRLGWIRTGAARDSPRDRTFYVCVVFSLRTNSVSSGGNGCPNGRLPGHASAGTSKQGACFLSYAVINLTLRWLLRCINPSFLFNGRI